MEIISTAYIEQLGPGDIIFQPVKDQDYVVDAVGEDFLLLSDNNERSAVRIIYFSVLIKEKWMVRSLALNKK